MQELKNGKKKNGADVLQLHKCGEIWSQSPRWPDSMQRDELLSPQQNGEEKLFQMLMCNKEVKRAVLKTSI